MRLGPLATAALLLTAPLAGCFGPSDRWPGLHLRGEVEKTLPADWTFADEHREIALEVRTPYLLPHSVTIWCAAVEGRLYVGARDPETKKWPGWVDRDPNVRLKIGSRIYEVRLTPVTDVNRLARVREAASAKYQLPPVPEAEDPPIRHWVVEPRA